MKQHVSFPFLLNGVYVYPMKVAADWQHAAEGRGGGGQLSKEGWLLYIPRRPVRSPGRIYASLTLWLKYTL